MIVTCNLNVFIYSFLVKTRSHFQQFGTVLLSQFAVENCDRSLQVSPLLCYFLLPLLQLLQLFLFLPPQSLQVPTLLLVQETMEVLKLGSDLSFQGIKTALKDGKGKDYYQLSIQPTCDKEKFSVWLIIFKTVMNTHSFSLC